MAKYTIKIAEQVIYSRKEGTTYSLQYRLNLSEILGTRGGRSNLYLYLQPWVVATTRPLQQSMQLPLKCALHVMSGYIQI